MEYNRLPDLKSLVTLKEVVERGGVSEAARRLNIGQPAVTKRLRSLEAIYDTHLMERIGGRLTLTESGRQVYRYAVQGLESHSELEKSLKNLRIGRQTLRLEVTMAIGEHFLSEWLVGFADRHPEFRVESSLAYGRAIEPRLATGQIDLAVLENAPDHPDVLVQQWREDEIVLVCAPSHPLAAKSAVERSELLSSSFILREKSAAIREHLDKVLEVENLSELNIAMEVGSTAAIIGILQRGRHASFLPWFAVASDVHEGKLAKVTINHFHISRTLWIARHRSNLDHQVAAHFIDMLQE